MSNDISDRILKECHEAGGELHELPTWMRTVLGFVSDTPTPQEHIKELERQLAEANERISYHESERENLILACDNAKEQLAAAQKDAERYRWLRSHHQSDIFEHRLVWHLPRISALAAKVLDQSIDAAIDKAEEGEG